MYKLVEDYATEKTKQTEIKMAANLLENGISVELVAKSALTLMYIFIAEPSKKYYNQKIFSSCSI